uniref:Uncharacterized protein n=1 Tax=Kryptolebias marmoratus TaxID=37003 RepID=A0A3Q3GHX6_KRYMA
QKTQKTQLWLKVLCTLGRGELRPAACTKPHEETLYCGSCYLINMSSVVGIFAADIVLTVFITISVFCFNNLCQKFLKIFKHLELKETALQLHG